MEVNATELGRMIGLKAPEMNQLLKLEGFLEGQPGDYDLTAKGLEFAIEHDHHRGTGGYPQYNAYWTTRRWNTNVLEQLDLSPENLKDIKDSVARTRRENTAIRKAAEAAASQKWLAQTQAAAETAQKFGNEITTSDLVKVGVIGTGAAAATALAFVVAAEAAPHVKRWWKEKAQPWLDDFIS